MPRWFSWVLASVAGLVLIAAAFTAYLTWSIANIDWNIPVYKEFNARDALMLELSEPACLSRDTVMSMSESRGWDVEEVDSLGQCRAPEGLSGWLRITTEDGLLLPDHPDNVTYFGFDSLGCSVYLPVLAGLGGICPEA